MARIIGIDLGHGYSRVAYINDIGVPECIPLSEDGDYAIPTAVFFKADNEAVIGNEASRLAMCDPYSTVKYAKYFMHDPEYVYEIKGYEHSPDEIIYTVAERIIRKAEAFLNEEIEGAVLTVPVYWGSYVLQRFIQSFERIELSNGSKLKVLKVIFDPVAATLALINDDAVKPFENILVYDLGDSFDYTVINVDRSGENEAVSILCTGGNHTFGGHEWSHCLNEYVMDEYCTRTGFDPEEIRYDPNFVGWFGEDIERAKRNLSKSERVILYPEYEGVKERIEITRSFFEEYTEHLLAYSISMVNEMLKKNNIDPINGIDAIMLVGGACHMPQVKNKLLEEYSKPVIAKQPEKLVAMGAAVFGNLSKCLRQASEYSYGIEFFADNEKQVMNLILKGSMLPATGKLGDLHPVPVNPNENLYTLKVVAVKNTNASKFFEADESVTETAEVSFSLSSGCIVDPIKPKDEISLTFEISDKRSGKPDKLVLTFGRSEMRYEEELQWKSVDRTDVYS